MSFPSQIIVFKNFQELDHLKVLGALPPLIMLMEKILRVFYPLNHVNGENTKIQRKVKLMFHANEASGFCVYLPPFFFQLKQLIVHWAKPHLVKLLKQAKIHF